MFATYGTGCRVLSRWCRIGGVELIGFGFSTAGFSTASSGYCKVKGWVVGKTLSPKP